MSFFDTWDKPNNVSVIRRYERAEAYAPLGALPKWKKREIIAHVRKAFVWEDVPLEYRRIMESSEENRREDEKIPKFYDWSWHSTDPATYDRHKREVLHAILSASTAEDIVNAHRLVSQWSAVSLEDSEEIYEALEQLETLADALYILSNPEEHSETS